MFCKNNINIEKLEFKTNLKQLIKENLYKLEYKKLQITRVKIQFEIEKKVKLSKLENEINILKQKLNTLYDKYDDIYYENFNNELLIKNCSDIKCNGLIYKSNCIECKKLYCEKCKEQINDVKTHICDKTILDSINLIKKDTKTCPSCATNIHKTNGGCDQMYCIQCDTAFSWETGEIDYGKKHSPDYYNVIKQKLGYVPRDPNDECFSLIPLNEFLKHIKNLPTVLDKYYECKNLISKIKELNSLKLKKKIFEETRKNYVLQTISKIEFKDLLYKNHLFHKHLNNYLNYINTYKEIFC